MLLHSVGDVFQPQPTGLETNERGDDNREETHSLKLGSSENEEEQEEEREEGNFHSENEENNMEYDPNEPLWEYDIIRQLWFDLQGCKETQKEIWRRVALLEHDQGRDLRY